VVAGDRGVIDRLRRGRTAVYYAGLGAGLIVFLYQVWRSVEGLREQQVGSPQLVSVAAASAMIAFAYLLQMLAWRQIMRGLGFAIDHREVLSRYVLSFLPRYIPGSVWGYLGRGEWLKTRCGVPHAVSAVSSVLEVGIGLLTALVIAATSYALMAWPSPARWSAVAAAVLMPWLSWLAYAVLRQQVFAGRLKAFNLLAAATAGVGAGRWLAACLIYYVFWLCYGGAVVLLLQGLAGHSGGWLAPTFAYALAWTAGFLILFVPSGLGAREAALSALLVWQLPISAASAGAVAIAARVAVLLAEIVWLLVGLALSRRGMRGGLE
jgi:uncharacterized membrane protein YbhN (UPF0104 family)